MRFKTLSYLALQLAVLMTAGPAVAQRGDDYERVAKNGAASGTIVGVEVSRGYGRAKG
jgi:hypothetical protein